MNESNEASRRAFDTADRAIEAAARCAEQAGARLAHALAHSRVSEPAANMQLPAGQTVAGHELPMADMGVSTGPVHAHASVLITALDAGSEWDGRMPEKGLTAGRRVRANVGSAGRWAMPAKGDQDWWLEGAFGAWPMPAAWGRPSRARRARSRRPGRCAPSWQQLGQPPGRPPGCHRVAGCPVGRDKLGKGPWLLVGG